MNRKYKVLKASVIFCFLWSHFSHAQNVWVWEHGDTVNGNPILGTKGVAHADNFPGAKYERPQWTDKEGNFWLMGGLENGNDLWKFDPTTKEWTWLHGTNSTAMGSYGIKTVPDASNAPPTSGFGSVTWVDTTGNLWLFGGNSPGQSSTNALWRYNIETNMWTWMNGTSLNYQVGTFGSKGVSAPQNTPGSITETTCGWTDKENNLWFFGGRGQSFVGGSIGNFNDLWKYNIEKNEWAWINGSGGSIDVPPNYGEKGVPAASNNPGGRGVFSSWIDSQGNFWIFGGFFGTSVSLSDLWKYDPKTNLWTWVSGSNQPYDLGNYGEKCATSPLYSPPARYENKVAWVDNCDNAWIFGGTNATSQGGGYLNDLWRYNTGTDEWTWVHGDVETNSLPSFGTKGSSTADNKPQGVAGNSFWHAKDGSVWMNGGGGDDVGRDILWHYIPDQAVATFSTMLDPDVSGKVNFMNNSYSGCNVIKSYEWDFGVKGTETDTSTLRDPTFIYTEGGQYDVKLVVTTCTGSKDSVINSVEIESTISNVFVPNSFTPNEDGINDVFIPQLNGPINNYRLKIYNRWGEVIFETNDREMGWDGRKKNKLAETGIYPYAVKFENITGETMHKNGKISLIR